MGGSVANFLDPLQVFHKEKGNFLANMLDPLDILHKPGGSGAAAAAPAIAPAAAPITAASPEVMQTQLDYQRMMARKRGFASAIFGGDTGGFNAQATTPGPMSAKTSNATGSTMLGA